MMQKSNGKKQKLNTGSEIQDRQPPHDLQAEIGPIRVVLMNGRHCSSYFAEKRTQLTSKKGDARTPQFVNVARCYSVPSLVLVSNDIT